MVGFIKYCVQRTLEGHRHCAKNRSSEFSSDSQGDLERNNLRIVIEWWLGAWTAHIYFRLTAGPIVYSLHDLQCVT